MIRVALNNVRNGSKCGSEKRFIAFQKTLIVVSVFLFLHLSCFLPLRGEQNP